MLCISTAYDAVMQSVCVSVTFVHCVKTNKDIVSFFSPSGSHTILVLCTKRDGNTPTGTQAGVVSTVASGAQPACRKL